MDKALVLGGTGGVGAAVARELVDMGVETWVTGRRESGPQGTQCISLTITQSGQTLEKLEREYPHWDDTQYLVCAFGPYLEAPLSLTSADQWSWVVDLNLVLPGMLVSRILPGMRSNRFGKIILFGATGSDHIRGRKLTAPYQAAKTGLGVLAKSVAMEAGGDLVECNVLCPGYIVTEYMPTPLKERATRRLGPRKTVSPQEYRSLFRWLLIENQGIVNGAVISAGQGL